MRPANLLLFVASLLAWSASLAGEVPGLPPSLPSLAKPDYTIYMGNDFLALGTNDDFRTQQMIAAARFDRRWLTVLDHSILTRRDSASGSASRIDQMSLSLGYEWYEKTAPGERTTLTAGIGVRGTGNFEGSRIQNGFHAMAIAETNFSPYESTRRTDATAWLLGEHGRILRAPSNRGRWGAWSGGYWLRLGTVATADGQFDAVAGAYAVATKPGMDLWLGLRQDWREGYTRDRVQHATAAEENKTALAFGLRWGPIVVETVQRFDSSASYGQLTFVSAPTTRAPPAGGLPDVDIQLSLAVPHVVFQGTGRWHRPLLLRGNSAWRESLTLAVLGGQPQLGQDPTRYAETAQLAAGLEWSRGIFESAGWLRFYTGLSLGYRLEKLFGRGDAAGAESAWYARPVLVGDLGIEIDAGLINNRWRNRLRLGLGGWLPSESVTVTRGGVTNELLEPGASIVVAWTVDLR